jgi:hypothetical protein
MFKFLLALVAGFSFQYAHADSSLADNGKEVRCSDGEVSLTLSADRKTIQLKIRDQDFGALPVLSVQRGTERRTGNYVSYTTSAGDLNLDDTADTFIDKWQAYFPDCE